MTVEQFRKFWLARPFHPFAIHLADGRMLEARHPERLRPSRGGRTIEVENADSVTEVVDLLLVISLRPLPSPDSGEAAPTGGGDEGGEPGAYEVIEPR